ncbi:hypothetical protein COOONC_22751 [Cooperia oncophora]
MRPGTHKRYDRRAYCTLVKLSCKHSHELSQIWHHCYWFTELAYLVCPDGMHPRQTCRRLFVNDVDMLENAANTDSCPLGYRCVTYGSPYVGHCCRLRCPYGEPDLRWKSSLCCPRPCRDPTSLYINGQCLSIAHRDDPCQIDQQCEGGISMSCALGTLVSASSATIRTMMIGFQHVRRPVISWKRLLLPTDAFQKLNLAIDVYLRNSVQASLTVDLERVNAYVDISRFE